MTWLNTMLQENQSFCGNIDIDQLPTERQPCPYAIITCMDPRINLEAVGIKGFKSNGAGQSQVRVIRTIGGITEQRSLVVGIHLAGFKELAVITHTDCGCSVAYSKIDKLIENMQANLSTEQWQKVNNSIAEPFRDNLLTWLRAFENPITAVKKEVDAIKNNQFVPNNLIVHGLVYDLSSGKMEVVVNGYEV